MCPSYFKSVGEPAGYGGVLGWLTTYVDMLSAVANCEYCDEEL